MEILCIILAVALVGALCAAFYLRGRLADAREALQRQQADFDRSNALAEKRFADLAAQALAQNSESLRRQNVNSLAEVMAPMKENIENFRRTIAERYDNEARERFALGKNVARLIELSQTVGAETAKLSTALKGNARVQGEWGEMILDTILQGAGLRKGYEYEVQASMNDDEGRRLRPDVVVNFPDDRHVVIDSKVSIQHYLRMTEANDIAERDAFAREHLASVRKHIGELARKSYQDVIGKKAFEYVLMFIPNEGAFLSAMSLDADLWHTAAESHVLIVSPAHLLGIIKLIEQMWRHERQDRNAAAIAEEAGRMLDKFTAFIEDMERIDRSLVQARESWTAAFSKLSTGTGNLVNRARKIEQLGAKSKRQIPLADE